MSWLREAARPSNACRCEPGAAHTTSANPTTMIRLRPAALLLLLVVASGGVARGATPESNPVLREHPRRIGHPATRKMSRARGVEIDLRDLPKTPPRRRTRPEREAPPLHPAPYPGTSPRSGPGSSVANPTASAPAPAPLSSYAGLDLTNWGDGWPPDTNGDVGSQYFIETVNTSIGIYRKSDGVRVAAFSFDTLMSQGSFGNLCDSDNFGDPVVLYDTFEDRWVITDFAFQVDSHGNVADPPGAYQCFAVSKSGDPVTGGWNFYSLHLTDALNDYPKLGIWPDGIYMSANMFQFPASGSYIGPRVWALDKAEMYAGAPEVDVVSFDPPASEFTLLPANARLQTGTPPPGTPNYFATVWNYTNAVSIYELHVDWQNVSSSTFTGPFIVTAPSSWSAPPSTASSPGGYANDTLAVRLMMQNQYTNLGGVESLWDSHTVANPSSSGLAAVRWYQVGVTGGTVASSTTQAATHAPDTTVHRYMPSLDVDRDADLAIGYSASSSSLYPAIRYAGRLSGDPPDSLPQTETSLIEGTGSQSYTNRWGDYSAMTLDPDGCTFWYANEYYATTGSDWQTRIGAFQFPSCTSYVPGSLSGTITASAGGTPIAGATVALGSRTATSDGSGYYELTDLAPGTYPGLTASAPGYLPSSASDIVVPDGGTATEDFVLDAAPTSGCFVDTTQADFRAGVPTDVNLTTSPGNVLLAAPPALDQQMTSTGSSGTALSDTTWLAQTFVPGVSGTLASVDVSLFCYTCSGSTSGLTVDIRPTSGGAPGGSPLASGSIPAFISGASSYLSVGFTAPPTLSSGTTYALVVHALAPNTSGTYAWLRSNNDQYPDGVIYTSTNSGGSWGATTNRDFAFRTYMQGAYALTGDLVSSNKDSNPAEGLTPHWSTLSWNATTPTNTVLRLQVAGSSSAYGPFDFVGPDSTASTYFTTSGASLSQFDGMRYLKYDAQLSTTDDSLTPTVQDVTLCFANGAPTNWVLAVDKNGTGTGSVSSTPPGIDCGSTCSASFDDGISVDLTATADGSSTFAGWSGDCAGTGTCTVSMTQARSVTATFTLKTFSLSVSKSGSGTGTVSSSPVGIDCGSTCSHSFDDGTSVTLHAASDVSSTFAGWSGSGCSGTADCVVSMTQARSVTATFTIKTSSLSVSKSGSGTGTVSSSPSGIDCGATCSHSFDYGTTVTLHATSDVSSTFAGWSGSGCSGTADCLVSMTQARSVTATFTIKTFSLSVSKSGSGTGTVSSSPVGIDCGSTCSHSFDYGTSVDLAATAGGNSTFTGWSGACSGTGTCTVSMTQTRSVTATFDPSPLTKYLVSVATSGPGGGTITSSPAGIDCGATCGASFDSGTALTLTCSPDATPYLGYALTGWSGPCTDTGPGTCDFSVDSAASVTANLVWDYFKDDFESGDLSHWSSAVP